MALSLEEVNQFKHAPVDGLLPVIAHRWSPRSFKETPIPAEHIQLILEAARWSASSSNVQPWRFLVGRKGSETHTKIFSTLVAFNQSWAGNPDLLIFGFADQKDAKGNINRYAAYDLGQATATLILQAGALGLMAHSMGGFDHNAARQVFGFTEDHVLGAVTAIGYQDEPSALTNEQVLEREVAARERKPLSEIALTALGQPLEF
jgi:nitroreductase